MVLQVNYGSLDGAVTALETAKGLLLQQISDLESKMKPMLNSWDGAAREAYVPLQTKWSTAASDLSDDIHALKTAVHDSNGFYQQNEQATLRMFSV
jgi:WXG100 family type VII secretion target